MARSLKHRSFKGNLQGIRTHSLWEVNLAEHGLGPEEAQALAAALSQDRTVTSLQLSGNQIGHRGALAVAEALKGLGCYKPLAGG